MIGNTNLLMAGDDGYNLTRSLRFRASASAYLSRTPASAGSRTTFTWSAWVKRGALGTLQHLFFAGTNASNNFFDLYFNQSGVGGASPTDALELYSSVSGQVVYYTTQSVRRDPSNWYHIVLQVDTTQSNAGLRVLLSVNGAQLTDLAGITVPPQNQLLPVNNTVPHSIGSSTTPDRYLDGYITEINFIDGQSLPASSFGSTNSTTGVWQPKAYTGTYGTNGFYLPFTDNSALTTSSNVGLGKDFSGNGNYWVTNNISITAGVTYDSMTDVPTLTSATAANYAVINPLDIGGSGNLALTQANLKVALNSGTDYTARCTIGVTSGKYYWEVTMLSTQESLIGVANSSASLVAYLGSSANGWAYDSVNGSKYNGTSGAYGATWTTNDVIGIALDMDAKTLTYYKNNVSQGVAFTNLAGTIFPAVCVSATGGSLAVNFGQRPFAYTPPTGFVALNAYNLPDSTIKQGNKVMDATLYTGNLVGQVITNAAGFKPDIVEVKSRSAATDSKVTDSVRGVTKALITNSSAAQTTDTNGLTAFNSNGFTLGSDSNYNASAGSFVARQWQAGQGSTSTNTSGTITSTVSVNASAGLSIVSYNGTGANATVGHGLGISPDYIWARTINSAAWNVYHSALGNTGTLFLQGQDAFASGAAWWNNTSPTSSVFSLGTNSYSNPAGIACFAYCWAAIAGFSAFGKYSGNGSTNGVFVYTGFRPKYLEIKRTDTTSNWADWDTSMNPSNVSTLALRPNLINGEISGWDIDILSNGFKIRSTNSDFNASGGTYMYACWAENPFKNALAR